MSLCLQGFVAVSAVNGTATLTTRQLRFRGDHLFVNVEAVVPAAHLRVAVEDAAGKALPGFELADSIPLVGTNSTIVQVSWREAKTLPVAARPPATVRLSFEMTTGMRLYAFWVAPTSAGHSGGYVGRGGPSFSMLRDVENPIKTDDLQLQSTSAFPPLKTDEEDVVQPAQLLHKLLFVDDSLFSNSSGHFSLRLQMPQKAGVVLEPELPWESASGYYYNTVIRM
eukprot:SAG22_NODE_6069_length_906_cov_0.857497_1_plen_224_part_01